MKLRNKEKVGFSNTTYNSTTPLTLIVLVTDDLEVWRSPRTECRWRTRPLKAEGRESSSG